MLWFDYLGVINAKKVFAPVYRLFGLQVQTSVTNGESDAALAADLDRLNTLWTEGLGRFGGDYLAGGRFTVPDAFYVPVVLRLHHYGLAGRLAPAARDYLARILALPAVQAWCA